MWEIMFKSGHSLFLSNPLQFAASDNPVIRRRAVWASDGVKVSQASLTKDPNFHLQVLYSMTDIQYCIIVAYTIDITPLLALELKWKLSRSTYP